MGARQMKAICPWTLIMTTIAMGARQMKAICPWTSAACRKPGS